MFAGRSRARANAIRLRCPAEVLARQLQIVRPKAKSEEHSLRPGLVAIASLHFEQRVQFLVLVGEVFVQAGLSHLPFQVAQPLLHPAKGLKDSQGFLNQRGAILVPGNLFHTGNLE